MIAVSSSAKRPRVYLAGPMVFYPDVAEVFAWMKDTCAKFGLEGVAPVDGQGDLVGIPPGRALSKRIVAADFALCAACDGAVVCLDPFHGPVEMDTGTAVEIGYLHALAKPMSGWITDIRPFRQRIKDFIGIAAVTSANSVGATSGVERDEDGMLVHSAELEQHGMAQMPIEMGGGRVHAYADWKVAFEWAVEDISSRLVTEGNRT